MILHVLFSGGIMYFGSLCVAGVMQSQHYAPSKYFYKVRFVLAFGALYLCLFGGAALVADAFCNVFWAYFIRYCIYALTAAYLGVQTHILGIRYTVTNRFIRLLIVNVALYLVIAFTVAYLHLGALLEVLPVACVFTVPLSDLLLLPCENKNNARYVMAAKQVLVTKCRERVGITGSYGKTSVKTMLEQLLSCKYRCFATPANYNTPLGIAKSTALIDREEVFIAEMGARHVGDIAELADIVQPTCAIITGITPQHIETFGSIENVMEEKNRLALAVPGCGVVVYNCIDERVRLMYEKRRGKKISVGFGDDMTFCIKVQTVTDKGSDFDIVHAGGVISVHLNTVGLPSVINFSLAAALAVTMGVEDRDIELTACNIQPAPHRQQVITSGGVRIIDDSYNINPQGAAAALDTLMLFSGGRKIVYCSGMVELGSMCKEMNYNLGKRLAEAADVIILAVNRYSLDVLEGAVDAGYPCEKVHKVRDTAEATELFRTLVTAGDTVLLMSDLPKEYLL